MDNISHDISSSPFLLMTCLDLPNIVLSGVPFGLQSSAECLVLPVHTFDQLLSASSLSCRRVLAACALFCGVRKYVLSVSSPVALPQQAH